MTRWEFEESLGGEKKESASVRIKPRRRRWWPDEKKNFWGWLFANIGVGVFVLLVGVAIGYGGPLYEQIKMGCRGFSVWWNEPMPISKRDVDRVGYINLEAIERAARATTCFTGFLRVANEVYQGEEIVLVEADGTNHIWNSISGYVDLNGNGQIDLGADELLFVLKRQPKGNGFHYEARGDGINSYYHCTYDTEKELPIEWSFYGKWSHMVSQEEVRRVIECRSKYRQSFAYRQQVAGNKKFQAKMLAKYGDSYRKAQPSAARKQWAKNKDINLKKEVKRSRKLIKNESERIKRRKT